MCGLQISQLSASTRQARMRSTVELLGRKQLAPGEELPLTPADPASRILEALLNVPDQAERLQMLPEALQAPDPATPAAEVLLQSAEPRLAIDPATFGCGVKLWTMNSSSSGSHTNECLIFLTQEDLEMEQLWTTPVRLLQVRQNVYDTRCSTVHVRHTPSR